MRTPVPVFPKLPTAPAPKIPATPAAPAPAPAAATPAQTSAYDMAKAQLDAWNLGTLAPKVIELIQAGTDENTMWLKLRETDEFKTRFAGNEILRQKVLAGEAGARVLSEAEYLNKEEQLRAQLSDPEWGLPRSFYDTPDDYAKMIGASLGAGEIQSRLQGIKTVITDGAMTGVADYARANYGLGTGDLIALWLDPEKAAPMLARISKASAIGAAAKRAGYGNVDKDYAEQLDALGISADQASSGFNQAASMDELTKNVGGDVGVAKNDVTDAIFNQDAGARARVERAQNARRARFAGGGSFAENKEGVGGLRSANT